MTLEQLRTAETQPFRPFTLPTAGRRRVRVRSPEFILAPESSRTFVLDQDNVSDVIDLLLVESLEFAAAKNGRPAQRNRGAEG